MSRGAIARRYGYALFQKGLDKGNLEEIDRDLDIIVHVFRDFPRIRRTYEDKKIYAERKKELFGGFFEGIIHDTVRRFLFLVIENYREEHLFAMAQEFLRLYYKHRGIVQATIMTALPLDKKNLAQIEDKLSQVTGKKVILEAKVVPSLIGGAILRFGDAVINTSLSFQLKTLEKKIRAGIREGRPQPASEVK